MAIIRKEKKCKLLQQQKIKDMDTGEILEKWVLVKNIDVSIYTQGSILKNTPFKFLEFTHQGLTREKDININCRLECEGRIYTIVSINTDNAKYTILSLKEASI